MTDDMISRQDAIDAICTDGTALERQGRYSLTMAERKQRDADILEALPSAQETQWIPLGRPMASGLYLVTLRQMFEGEETFRVCIMRLQHGHWVYPRHFPEWINDEMEQEVLAWMPLPEPYEGEDNVIGK